MAYFSFLGSSNVMCFNWTSMLELTHTHTKMSGGTNSSTTSANYEELWMSQTIPAT